MSLGEECCGLAPAIAEENLIHCPEIVDHYSYASAALIGLPPSLVPSSHIQSKKQPSLLPSSHIQSQEQA
jgi:hypothetical protein